MCLYPLGEGCGADLLLSFYDELYVVAEFAFPDKILQGLDMHEGLPLVIVGAAPPDGPVVDHRFERI